MQQSPRDFQFQYGYVFEQNDFFILEDISDVIATLQESQFIAAVRYGSSQFKKVNVHERTSWLTGLYFQHINPVTANCECTFVFPIKEVRCFFSKMSAITQQQAVAIEAAAKNAFKSSLSSSFLTIAAASSLFLLQRE